jgi:hypothetical protein
LSISMNRPFHFRWFSLLRIQPGILVPFTAPACFLVFAMITPRRASF